MRHMNQTKISKAGQILVEAGIVLFLGLIFLTNLLHFNYMMNADLASDAVLARLIWTSKEIIPSTWYIAAETRIIGTPNIAALFYGMTGNMVFAEGMACCLMTVFIVISIVFFGKKADLKRLEIDLLVLLGLALPVNKVILELLYLFASYYAVHTAILFFTLGVYAESIKKEKMKPVSAGLSLIFALCLGMQGVRGILILYGPLFGIEAIRTLYRFYSRGQQERQACRRLAAAAGDKDSAASSGGFGCKEKSKKADFIISLWVCTLLVVSFIGTCFPFSEGQEFSRNIRKGLFKLATVVLPNAKRAIGFDQAGIYGKIILIILVAITCCLLVELICRMWKKEPIEAVNWAFLVICASPVVTALIISFTTFGDSERYYFLLIYAMAFAVVLVGRRISGRWKSAGEILIAIFVIINVYTVYLPILKSAEPPQTDEYIVGKYLEENQYRTAYSTFDNANLITVLTNGRVQVSAVSSVDKMDICKWMTSTQWYVPNVPFKERTAYIIPESQEEKFKNFLTEHKNEVDFLQKIGEYSIYVSDYNFSVLD